MAVQDPRTTYLEDIRRITLVTREEELDLAKKIKDLRALIKKLDNLNITERDKTTLINLIRLKDEARNQLVSANLRLVVFVVKNYLGRSNSNGIDFLELITEGNLALIRAAECFDWETGNKFSTYAVASIKRAIGKLIFEKITNRRNLGSLSEKDHDDLLDKREDGTQVLYNEEAITMIRMAVEKLPEREKVVVKLRFGFEDGIPHFFYEIGQKLGITGERAKQIFSRGFKLLCKNREILNLQ